MWKEERNKTGRGGRVGSREKGSGDANRDPRVCSSVDHDPSCMPVYRDD